MVTDQQVRKLMSLIPREKSLARAAAKAGMDEKTARKYRRLGKLPSELKPIRTYRTREDPFAGVWGEMREKLESHSAVQFEVFGLINHTHSAFAEFLDNLIMRNSLTDHLFPLRCRIYNRRSVSQGW